MPPRPPSTAASSRPTGCPSPGLVVGLGCAAAAAGQLWWLALAAWWISRSLDGLDGALARRRADRSGLELSPAGGFLDITADFVVYGATTVGVLVGVTRGDPDGAALATWAPFVAVLLAYYVNGSAFLAFSSIAERAGRRIDDGRSLSFIGGLAEGTETIVVHSLWLLLPAHAAGIAWVWAGVVLLSGASRIVAGYRLLDQGRP